jgi:hypothetical protein
MGGKRGPARDSLPDEKAAFVRKALRSAREQKGLTNAEIAEALDCDVRFVTATFDETRTLRASRAIKVAHGIFEATARQIDPSERRQRDDDACSALLEAFGKAGLQFWPPASAPISALIDPSAIEDIAKQLAEDIGRKAGIVKRLSAVQRALVSSLKSACGIWAEEAILQLTIAAGATQYSDTVFSPLTEVRFHSAIPAENILKVLGLYSKVRFKVHTVWRKSK